MSRVFVRRLLLFGLPAALLLAVGGLVAAYCADASAHAGKIARAVRVGDISIGGKTADEVRGALTELDKKFAQTRVEIHDGDVVIPTTAGDLGLSIDQESTLAAAQRAGRKGGPLGRFFRWVGSSLGSDDTVTVKLHLDESKAVSTVDKLDTTPGVAATEPGFVVADDGSMSVVAGKPGVGLEPKSLVDALHTASYGSGVLRFDVARGTVAPRFSVIDAQALLSQVDSLTASAIAVKIGPWATGIDPLNLRKFVTTKVVDNKLAVALDNDKVLAYLAAAFPTVITPPVNATYTVDQSWNLVPVPAKNGTGCCAPEAADALFQAMQSHPPDGVELPTKAMPPALGDADLAALGIKEPVSSFVTFHPCCAARVKNIHIAADTIRGVILKPGETFSLDNTLGKRTTDKGYVVAPVIEGPTFGTDVGGGVSQLSTTLLNAVWFSGLEILEGHPHSIYISRYPFGREATLSYGLLDNRFRNDSPYGVFIWTSYTETSVRVTLYSTKYVDARQTNQRTAPSGKSCLAVDTERTVTYLDGSKPPKKYVYHAKYQAADGFGCDDDFPPTTTTGPNPTGPNPTGPPPTYLDQPVIPPNTTSPPSASTIPKDPPPNAGAIPSPPTTFADTSSGSGAPSTTAPGATTVAKATTTTTPTTLPPTTAPKPTTKAPTTTKAPATTKAATATTVPPTTRPPTTAPPHT